MQHQGSDYWLLRAAAEIALLRKERKRGNTSATSDRFDYILGALATARDLMGLQADAEPADED